MELRGELGQGFAIEQRIEVDLLQGLAANLPEVAEQPRGGVVVEDPLPTLFRSEGANAVHRVHRYAEGLAVGLDTQDAVTPVPTPALPVR